MSVGVKTMKIKVRSKLGSYLDKRMVNKSQLAREIGAQPKQVYAWCENNKDGYAVSTPSVGYLLKMEKVLNASIQEFYEVEE